MGMRKGRRLVLALLFMCPSFLAVAQGEPDQVFVQRARVVPGVLQVDRLRGQLEEAQTDQERYRLLTQLVRMLEHRREIYGKRRG